jgi:hypothetical protein
MALCFGFQATKFNANGKIFAITSAEKFRCKRRWRQGKGQQKGASIFILISSCSSCRQCRGEVHRGNFTPPATANEGEQEVDEVPNAKAATYRQQKKRPKRTHEESLLEIINEKKQRRYWRGQIFFNVSGTGIQKTERRTEIHGEGGIPKCYEVHYILSTPTSCQQSTPISILF